MEARGPRGGVAAGHPQVCEAAAAVLRAGGNAFDAAVAAGFASAVCEPALTSLGGGGFLLAWRPDAEPLLFDFFADTPGRGLPADETEPHFLPVTVRFPGSAQVFNVGLGSCAVPGALRGYLHVHARLGALPLAEVVAPAAALAREGVALNAHQAYFLGLLEPIVTLRADGRAIHAPGGRLLREGERLRNADLAAFLEDLPRGGAAELYEGGLARRIARDMRDGGGLVTEADLAAYRVVERRPLAVRYRGHRLLTNPPPSFGGSLLALSLRLLEEGGAACDAPAGPARATALLAVMREVDGLRADGCLHPDALDALPAGARDAVLGRVRRFARGTTQVSTWDASGRAASMTTSNGEGSGYVVPGTGILLNNMLGEDDLHPDGFHTAPAGERVASMMSPSVLLSGGAPHLVLGSGGSKRIRTALLQVTSGVVDFGMAPGEAVHHPRLHWDGETVQVEPGFPAETLDALRRLAPVNVWECPDVYFGGVHAATPGGEGAGDPRRGGCALVVPS